MAENVSTEKNNSRFTDYPYDLRRDSWTDLQRERLRLMCERIRPGERVLDVGCNSGYLHEFAPPDTEIHGVDMSPDLVAIAATRYASAQVAPAEHLPFLDRSFDVVIAGAIIEYVYDPLVMLKELARVSRRAVVGCADHESGIWGSHRVERHTFMVRSYNENRLRADLSTIGDIDWLDKLEWHGTNQYYLWEVAPSHLRAARKMRNRQARR